MKPSAGRKNRENTNVLAVGNRHASTRAELLHDLAAAVPGESLFPIEATLIAVARLNLARFVARRAWIRHLVEEPAATPPGPGRRFQQSPAPVRPVPRLSRLNRSRVVPDLVRRNPGSIVCLVDLVDRVRRAHAVGVPPSELLDALATSCGLGCDAASSILKSVTGETMSADQVDGVRTARRFWTLYAEGAARLAALQEIGDLPSCCGQWAYFDRVDFAALLPGAILPDHFERAEFLTNYVADGAPQSLDVYSVGFRPLFRHEFGGPPRPSSLARSV